VLGYSADGGWLEEPLETAKPLPRLLPWEFPKRAEAAAFQALAEVLTRSAATVSAKMLAKEREETIAERCQLLIKRDPSFPAARLLKMAARMARIVSSAGEVTVAHGHGDFQPGNVLVRPKGEGVWLIDWEDAGLRWVWYDFMVFALRARSPQGLLARCYAIDRAGLARTAPERLRDFSGEITRASGLALYVLEELLWCLDDECGLDLPRVTQRTLTLADEMIRVMV
jgi:aminoglycoside phosphotransferase (APT) family kinase protein